MADMSDMKSTTSEQGDINELNEISEQLNFYKSFSRLLVSNGTHHLFLNSGLMKRSTVLRETYNSKDMPDIKNGTHSPIGYICDASIPLNAWKVVESIIVGGVLLDELDADFGHVLAILYKYKFGDISDVLANNFPIVVDKYIPNMSFTHAVPEDVNMVHILGILVGEARYKKNIISLIETSMRMPKFMRDLLFDCVNKNINWIPSSTSSIKRRRT
jgi:hypothetical protein